MPYETFHHWTDEERYGVQSYIYNQKTGEVSIGGIPVHISNPPRKRNVKYKIKHR